MQIYSITDYSGLSRDLNKIMWPKNTQIDFIENILLHGSLFCLKLNIF